MEIAWGSIKEAFYAIGSIAGIAALSKPIFEAKYAKDLSRVNKLLSSLSEQELINLESMCWNSRLIDSEIFEKLNMISHEVETNQDSVRFSGLSAKYLEAAVRKMLVEYERLRMFVQVPEWEPITSEDGRRKWSFNKQAFEDKNGTPMEYAQHLDKTAEQAYKLRMAYQELQITAELHFYEAPFAKYLIKRRNLQLKKI